MFWLVFAFIGVTLLRHFLLGKSKAEKPGNFETPEVPSGTPIPVAFGTNKMEPIFVEWSAELIPYHDAGGQDVGWDHIVTFVGLMCWGPVAEYTDIIYDETKKLSDQGPQFYFNVDQQYVLGFAFTPPDITAQTFPSAVIAGGLSAEANPFSYAEIYIPRLFNGNPPKGEGGIRARDPGKAIACLGRFLFGAEYWFFSGFSDGVFSPGEQPPLDDVRYHGTMPKDDDCNDVPTTSGTGRINYAQYAYVRFTGSVGTSPVWKKQEFIVHATFPTEPTIGVDANPATVIHEILINTEWGLGLSPALIDNGDTFQGTATLMVSEGFGISGVLREQKSAEDYIGEILRTIDAVLYRHPVTGLLSIKAIRADYDPATLPVFDESVIAELEWTRTEIADTTNEINVAYVDRDRLWNRNVVTVQDHANIHATGEVRSQTFEFPYIPTETLALKVAARELKANTLPLGRGTMLVNRTAWSYVPGDVIAVSWSRYSLDAKPCRILSVSSGTMDDGLIQVDVVEDVYGLPDVPYTVIEGTWDDPAGTPTTPIDVLEAHTDDGTEGEATLTIVPPEAWDLVVSVEFSTQTGRDTASSYGAGTQPDPDVGQYVSPRVTLSTSDQSFIYWIVTYTDAAGDEQTITGKVTFAASGSAPSGTTGSQIVINDGSGGFIDVFDSTANEVVS